MLYTITEERPARLTVLSYDIHSPRRAYRVRKALEPWRQAKQYSVYETLLGYGEFRGLTAELAECCDFTTDRLASLMGRCRYHLAEEDRLWAYPLRGSHALWQIGAREAVVLPIATHHWSTS